jgi:GDP-L-fucose synthase
VNIVAACAFPGEPRDGILREHEIDDGPLHPSADNYGISKRVALLQAKHYQAQYGLNVTSVVLANTYGPGDHVSADRSHVVGALVRKFFEAKRDMAPEVEVWGRGIAERDLLYVDDAVTGVLGIVERCPDAGLINIGTGRGTPIREIAETIREVIAYPGEIRFDPSRPEGPLKKTLDISRLRELLSWDPPTPLGSGLQATLAWLNDNYAAAVHAA